MIKGNTFLSYYTKDDFRAAFGVSNPGLVFAGTSAPGTNQYAWNDTYKSVRVSTDSNSIGFVSFDLGFLEIGDLVDLEAEIWNMTGEKARIALDHFTGTGIDDGTKTTWYIDSTGDNTDAFKLTNYPFAVYKPGYYRATIGLWKGQAGEYRMRNCACKIQSVVRKTEPLNRTIHFRMNVTNGSATITYRKGAEYVDSIINDSTGILVNLRNVPSGSFPFLQYVFASSQAFQFSDTKSISYMYMRGSGETSVLIGMKENSLPTTSHTPLSSIQTGIVEIRIML